MSHKKKHTNDFGRDPIPGLVLRVSVPFMVAQFVNVFYSIADRIFIGNLPVDGQTALAGAGVCAPIVTLLSSFAALIGIGGSILFSMRLGQKNHSQAEQILGSCFSLLMGFSAALTILFLLLKSRLLWWFGASAETFPYADTYLTIYTCGTFFALLSAGMNYFITAQGFPALGMATTLIGAVLNLILDPVFLFGLDLGIAGAAVATVIAQGLSVLLCLSRMVKDGGAATIHWKELRFHKEMIRQVIVQGLPTGLQNSVISIGNLVVQSNINTFGAFAISGQGAFAKLEGIAFLPIMSMSMALTTFVSQNLGAGRADRAKKGSAIGLAFGMVMAELVGICLFIWIPILLRIFVDAPEAIRFGTIHGRTVALFFFLLAFSNCASGVLRGAGKSVVPMFTMLICWCGIRVLYVTIALRIIPVFRTISSAYPLTWSLSSIIFIVFLLRMDWEKQI